MVVAFGLLASACGGDGDDSGPAASAAPPARSADSSEPGEGTPALDPVFVPTASGEQLDFNSLRGKDVLLWFWAPW
jgi:hypothetical protein